MYAKLFDLIDVEVSFTMLNGHNVDGTLRAVIPEVATVVDPTGTIVFAALAHIVTVRYF